MHKDCNYAVEGYFHQKSSNISFTKHRTEFDVRVYVKTF